MAKTIWKYPIQVTHFQSIAMPEGAAVLSVQLQGEIPCLWAEVDPLAPTVIRTFVTYGTGHPLDPALAKHYLGTYQKGAYVWHVYTDRLEMPVRG